MSTPVIGGKPSEYSYAEGLVFPWYTPYSGLAVGRSSSPSASPTHSDYLVGCWQLSGTSSDPPNPA